MANRHLKGWVIDKWVTDMKGTAWEIVNNHMGFPGGSNSKESACNVGDLGSIPGLGGSPGEGKGYPLQYSGHGVAKSQTWQETHSDSSISESFPFSLEQVWREHWRSIYFLSQMLCVSWRIHPIRKLSVCLLIFLWCSDLPVGSGLSLSSIQYGVPH